MYCVWICFVNYKNLFIVCLFVFKKRQWVRRIQYRYCFYYLNPHSANIPCNDLEPFLPHIHYPNWKPAVKYLHAGASKNSPFECKSGQEDTGCPAVCPGYFPGQTASLLLSPLIALFKLVCYCCHLPHIVQWKCLLRKWKSPWTKYTNQRDLEKPNHSKDSWERKSILREDNG